MPQNEEEGNTGLRLLNDYPLEVYSVRLSPYHARMARLIGNGNLTSGIRTSIEITAKLYKDKKEPK